MASSFSPDAERAAAIVDFWRQTEFFIPYDVDQALDAHPGGMRVFRVDDLQESLCGSVLWRDETLPADKALGGFVVYCNLFDKARLGDEVIAALDESADDREKLRAEAAALREGRSCLARFKVNAQGLFIADSLEISTAPWALARLRKKSALRWTDFEDDMQRLQDDFAQWLPPPEESLHGERLKDIARHLYRWLADSCLYSEKQPLLAVKAFWQEKKKPRPDAPTAEEDDDGGGEETEQQEIGILNSFFIKDLTKVHRALAAGECPAVLAHYLGGCAPEARVDLYAPQGAETLARHLSPRYLPAGRWLQAPQYRLSLMQQFAVNTFLGAGENCPLFSVNGPPGTGKTTLLRDVFAAIFVQRARVLAKLSSAADAFDRRQGKVTVQSAGKKFDLLPPIPALCGFEMVVVSANNAAVENISRDLPKNAALDEAFRGETTYLHGVACNFFEKKAKQYVQEADPWGLFACPLGNKKNRNALVDGVFFTDKHKKDYDEQRHQTIWTWRKTADCPSFAEARAQFRRCDAAVAERSAQLEAYARRLGNQHAEETRLSTAQDAADARLKAAICAVEAAEARCAQQRGKAEEALLYFQAAQAREQALPAKAPGLWMRLFAPRRVRAALAERETRRQELLQAQAVYLQTKAALQAAENQRNDLAAEAADARCEAQACRHALLDWQQESAALAAEFPDARAPQDAQELTEDRWQIAGLWQDAALAEARAELFAAAVQLQESWLKEAQAFTPFLRLLQWGFKQDIPHLPPEQAVVFWQLFFLLIPVVSSTFASFAAQFGNLPSESLGYVFVDEAGQAVPQAVVGALWRARRAMVVGDPLQIEPVFTVPAAPVNTLEKISGVAEADVSPLRHSVQTLADRGNRYGALLNRDGEPLWIGSPLRVHRRCVEPMFGMSNAIAYQGKMVFYAPDDPDKRRPPQTGVHLGDSAWVECAGEAKERQYVAEQGELVRQMLRALYCREGQPPALYIISPFRKIREKLLQELAYSRFCAALPVGTTLKKSVWQQWCNRHIGTVHTFQGKEESMVWLVLGCDPDSSGAAAWAAEKPNLLNVALTRAKHRIFIIGDSCLWGNLPYFSTASSILPHIDAAAFLARLPTGKSGGE